jgi:hypothetical protein
MIDKNGYEHGKISHSDLIHRQIAYEYIYLKHRDKYPLPFSKYVIHHKDGNKLNNDISNLEILTPEKHSIIHGYKTTQKSLNYLKEIEKERKNQVKRLSEEIKKGRKIKFLHDRKQDKRKRRFKIFIIAIIILFFFILIFNGIKENFNQEPKTTMPEDIPPTTPIPETEPIIIEGSKTEVIITNNQDKDISLNVTYRIFSDWFKKDSTESKIFDVESKTKKYFQVYFNDGCLTAPCSVSIISYEER